MKTCNSFLVIVLALMATSTQAAGTIEMTVNGLVCGFCAQGIEKRLRRFPATADVLVSLEKRLVAVALKADADIPDASLTEALEDSGYAVKEIRRSTTPLSILREQIGRKR